MGSIIQTEVLKSGTDKERLINSLNKEAWKYILSHQYIKNHEKANLKFTPDFYKSSKEYLSRMYNDNPPYSVGVLTQHLVEIKRF